MDNHDIKKQLIQRMLDLDGNEHTERRKHEDLLQSVLTILLEYNSEYAKGIEELIKSGLDGNEILLSLQQKTEAMRMLLESLADSYSTLEELVRELHEDNRVFTKSSLKPVYEFIGVKEDGSSYAPLDSIVVQIKQALTSKLLYLLAGALIVKFIPIILTAFK